MSIWYAVFRQCFFIPQSTFTPDDLPDQTGRVFIVTGGYAGCGKELCKILYKHNGTVYVAGRSADKAASAIDEITAANPGSNGRLNFLHVDLGDLPSIKKAAETFLSREQRLDVLTNNAGVMVPPAGSKTEQGYELQMGTNCVGPYLFTELLTPLLEKTAASSPAGSVRVTWAASLATMGSPAGGVEFDSQTGKPVTFGNPGKDYAQSKACNMLLAQAWAAHHDAKVISVAWNPGNLVSELQRHLGGITAMVTRAICYPTHYGALTELFAGWGPEVAQAEQRGRYVGPWGRFVQPRADLAKGAKAEKFWQWCAQETKEYLS